MCLSLALFSYTQKDSNPNTAKGDKPRVVATGTIIADLAQEVAGDEIQLSGILKPGTAPYVYEPVPADSKVLQEANLILYNSYNLESGLIKLMNASGHKAGKLAVGVAVKSLMHSNIVDVPMGLRSQVL